MRLVNETDQLTVTAMERVVLRCEELAYERDIRHARMIAHYLAGGGSEGG